MTGSTSKTTKHRSGIFKQIMTLITVGVVILTMLMFTSIFYLLNMQQKQLDLTMEMLRREIQYEKKVITASQDNKINVIVSILTLQTPDLIWAYDLESLNLYAKSIVKDADIDSVTFRGKDGTFLAGNKTSNGTKTISRDIIANGEKLGSIVIGINTDHLDQSLLKVKDRITGFELISAENIRESNTTVKILIFIMVGVLIAILFIMYVIIKNITDPIQQLSIWTRQVAAGDLNDFEISTQKNEIGKLNTNFSHMVDTLRESASEKALNLWLKDGQSLLDEQIRGSQIVRSLALRVLTFIARYLDAKVGALYLNNGEDVFTFVAGYGFTPTEDALNEFSLGDGYIGQAALDRKLIIIDQVPDDYLVISSSLGDKNPATVLVQPFVYNDQVLGVMELGSFNKFTEEQITFLQLIASPIAVAMHTARSRVELQTTLDNTQKLNEESKAQQQKLQEANEAHEKQAHQLQSSEEELRAQQEELQSMNAELMEKSRLLEDQLKAEENK